MSEPERDELDLNSVKHLLGYFDLQVLASYRNEPHKYLVESDSFEGRLRITEEYYRELEQLGKTDERVYVDFGYRTLKDGNLGIVAWLPDLFEKSKSHVPRWQPWYLKDPHWTTDDDERFEKWVRRYVNGDWNVDNGPSYYLGESIRIINSLTSELVDVPLYKHELGETLSFPSADNTHRYQDAHEELYGYVIDGLDKDCISRLAARLGRSIKVGPKKTVEALVELFPALKTSPNFMPAMKRVSDQRHLASHGVRPPATKFPAFSQFAGDLALCLEAVKEILTVLEREFGVNGEEARNRHEAKKQLPRITRPPQAHFSIVQASLMKGKTIERVESGFRKEIERVHESEALIIHFTDGSIMSLEGGSNVGNLVSDENGLRPEDFHVSFVVHWVPELPKGMQKSAL
jgi:hypothetical protein